MSRFHKYFWIAYTSARSNLAYSREVVLRATFMGVILYVFLRLWTAVYAESGDERLGGLTLRQMVWYLMVTESFWMSSVRLSSEVDEDVRTGRLAVQLMRPMSYSCALLGRAIGERAIRFGVNLAAGVAIALALVGPIPISLSGLAMFSVVLPLSFVLDALGLIVVGLCAFWLESTMGLTIMYTKTIMLAGGAMLPLDLYPEMLRKIFEWLPFAAMIYGPSRILVSGDSGLFFRILTLQGAAIIVFGAAVYAVQSAAFRRIHSHGG